MRKIINEIMLKLGYKKYDKFLDPYKDLIYEVIKESAERDGQLISVHEGIFKVRIQAINNP